MRVNKFVGLASGLSRRAADAAIGQGRVTVDGQPATLGQEVTGGQTVTLDGQTLYAAATHRTILLNKPVGYVVSRNGQGSRTIYDLLPAEFHSLKPIGRLDKDSSGLLLLTNDGVLAHELTHPRFAKEKVYEVVLHKPLAAHDQKQIMQGVQLEDGPSKLHLSPLAGETGTAWKVTLREGRNRQIRRTFAALHYDVKKLHRTQFGPYSLSSNLRPGDYISVAAQPHNQPHKRLYDQQ